MRLEIEDDVGFKWALVYDRNWVLMYHTVLLYHDHAEWDGGREHLCLRYYDRDRHNQPIDKRMWVCGACNHKVPVEVEEYYDMVVWGLETGMFDEETT